MQTYAFPRTSGARNPIVIVKIFVFIFLRLKVVLQFGGLVQTPANISDTKNYIYQPAGGTITQANTFLPITPKLYVVHSKTPDSLNGAKSLCDWPRPLLVRKFFRKNLKTYFFELPLGILSDLHETWHIHSSAGPDLKLSKEFCSVKKCANY